jgi:hypothetical protein
MGIVVAAIRVIVVIGVSIAGAVIGRGRLYQQSGRLGVLNGIAVTLLGQEKLAVGGEFLIAGIAGHNRIKVRRAAILFGAQEPSEPLRLLLA